MWFRRAEMGVGTLIIFISLLLVAAVAAGVLVQTASSLQQKALSTGSQATNQVATNAMVLDISGVDGTASLTNISMIMKLSPGSEPITLDDVTLTISTANSSQSLSYQSSGSISATEFNASYLQTGVTNQAGRMVRGDVVELNFLTSRALVEGEDLRIHFIPKIGSATQVVFTLPGVISTERVHLYP